MAKQAQTLEQTIEQTAATLKALAHPLRVDIVICLETYEMTVGTLANLIAASPSLTSRQLKILHAAGIVDVRQAGREHFYFLVDPRLSDTLSQLMRARLA